MTDTTHALTQRIGDDGFAGYAYSYPHKTSYRPFEPPVPLADAWANEDRSALFLYTHLPFCEMRCGFCNLFTAVRPDGDLVAATLDAIARQAAETVDVIHPNGVAQAAFGGGTPSFLSTGEIVELFAALAEAWPVDWAATPTSFEVSPATIDADKLAALHELGVNRISMGVQSFSKADLKALARPQRPGQVDAACAAIADAGFELYNLDLIYGMADQSVDDWLFSLAEAVKRGPNELYLYPLYVRELTGLWRTGRQAGDHRLELYRLGRDFLLDAGFEQLSMRHFRHRSATPTVAADYCCQDDGMVGLGPGARSYTTDLHYASEYAVGQPGVVGIIDDFCGRDRYDLIDYGVYLDDGEQQRRYVIKSLLRADGLDLDAFTYRFGAQPHALLPQLHELVDGGFAQFELGRATAPVAGGEPVGSEVPVLRLTAEGLAHSDVIGPWLYSPEVEQKMADYELR